MTNDYKAALESPPYITTAAFAVQAWYRANFDAIHSALKLAGRMQWQPIETAPKDGKDYLFYTPQYGGRCVVTYLYPDGKMGHNHFVEQFTHWMPLPQPPKENEG